jgi:predicted phosphodiesterase
MTNKKNSFKKQIVMPYIGKFQKTPSLSLARKIYQEHSADFKNVEEVRSFVRVYRGVSGKVSRKKIIDKSNFIEPFKFAKNPYNLPRSYKEEAKVFTLPKDCNNVLVLSDLHIPYHDYQALNCAIKYGKENDINCIFINGDLMDFYQISRFTNRTRKRSVKAELEACKTFLGVLNREFPNIPIFFLQGNHDIRLEMYLATKAPELLDMEEFKLEILLEAEKYGMKVFDENTLVKMGKLNVTHGHLLIRGIIAPVNSARGAFLKAKASTLIGHVHKISTHSESTITGKVITCYSTGCLCELNPLYSPFGNNYTHGFCHVQIQPNGHYHVKNIQIIDGEIIN